MTFTEFDKYTEEILAKVRKMRDSKGREYTVSGTDEDADRFANFIRSAEKIKINRLKAWFILFDKHYHSLVSYINEEREFSEEGIEGRIVDMVTYLILAGGMIKEDKAKAPKVTEFYEGKIGEPVPDSPGRWLCFDCWLRGLEHWNIKPRSQCHACGVSSKTSSLKWLDRINTFNASYWNCQLCNLSNLRSYISCVYCGCDLRMPDSGV